MVTVPGSLLTALNVNARACDLSWCKGNRATEHKECADVQESTMFLELMKQTNVNVTLNGGSNETTACIRAAFLPVAPYL